MAVLKPNKTDIINPIQLIELGFYRRVNLMEEKTMVYISEETSNRLAAESIRGSMAILAARAKKILLSIELTEGK